MKRQIVGTLALVGCLVGLTLLKAADPPNAKQAPPKDANGSSPPVDAKPAKLVPAVEAKPLSDNVNRGLKWLVEHQLKNGAWGQGEESQAMGGGAALRDVPSVADTCMAALALLRSGSSPAQGPYAKNVLDAVKFVCGEIEESDKATLDVTRNHSTRVQMKLGTYIDTFAASLLLAEMKEKMPDEASEKRLGAALEKLLAKIQKNQRPDGTWAGNGWATTMQQNFAVKGINRAAQKGVTVDEKVRELAESEARSKFSSAGGAAMGGSVAMSGPVAGRMASSRASSYSGPVTGPSKPGAAVSAAPAAALPAAAKSFSSADSAGVELYSAGATLSNVTQSDATNATQVAELKHQAQSASAPADRAAAAQKLARFDAVKKDQAEIEKAVIARLDDKQFLAGFGSNGGEEFLSYLNIGESLVVKGGDNWKSWDKSITENLNRIQNADGSWSGHHCITGRTFCTSAAMLVLMVDRAPSSIFEKMKRR